MRALIMAIAAVGLLACASAETTEDGETVTQVDNPEITKMQTIAKAACACNNPGCAETQRGKFEDAKTSLGQFMKANGLTLDEAEQQAAMAASDKAKRCYQKLAVD